MAIHYSLSMIMAWRIFKFSHSFVSSLDHFAFFFDTTSLVFSKPCSFHNTPNTPFDSERRGESASERGGVVGVAFLNSIVMARLVLKGPEGLEEREEKGIGHWSFPPCPWLLLFHDSWGWSKGMSLVGIATLYLYIGSLSPFLSPPLPYVFSFFPPFSQ